MKQKNQQFSRLICQIIGADSLPDSGYYQKTIKAFMEHGTPIAKATLYNWLHNGVPHSKLFLCEELSRKFSRTKKEVITAKEFSQKG
jgi:hypothetical protein